MRSIKYGTSWVRGIVGESFTPEVAIDLARAFGTWVEGAPIVIGRDARRSSPMIRSAALAGLQATGCDVIDVGLGTTPLVSYAIRTLGAGGGISITGSHNEAGWNALKFLGPDGALLNAVRGEELLDIHHASAFRAARIHAGRRFDANPDLRDRYVEQLLCLLDTDLIRRRGFRIAADFQHGPASDPASSFLERLNVTLTSIQPCTGRLPASFSTEVCRDVLSAALRETGADLGAAVNMDGDRIAFATGGGRLLSGELTLPLLALQRLRRRPGPLVLNYSTSARAAAVAEQFGQPAFRAPVGESHVMDRALEENAVLAGEGGGGAAALPGTMTFDALLSLGLVLEGLACTETDLAETVEAIPPLHMRKGTIPCPAPTACRIMARFRDRFRNEEPDLTDGLRLEWKGGAWLHIRVSNTEPILRIICEARDPARAERLFRNSMEFGRACLRDLGHD